MSVLGTVYGDLVVTRAPVPVTVNKAGANYKSEVTHLNYSPRQAYREWLAILDAVVACGGDSVCEFEPVDDAFLDCESLRVDERGQIFCEDSTEVSGKLADIETGRVFAANGPWVSYDGTQIRAVMPNMLAHRANEHTYYRGLLEQLAEATSASLEVVDNPHRWEGMADVAVVGERVVLTYAVPGHYDSAEKPKSERSSLAGVTFAADFMGVSADQRIFAELVYPHFHGDTVHFGARPTQGDPILVHYPGGLWNDGSAQVVRALGGHFVEIRRDDAVQHYAGNSRQIGSGLLTPDGVSNAFVVQMQSLGLTVHRLPLVELFGKGGGGPACATLYLPSSLTIPTNASFRYSVQREAAHARASRIPETLTIDAEYFRGKARG